MRSRIGHGSAVFVATCRSFVFQPPQNFIVSGSRTSEVNFATSRLSSRFQAHEFFQPHVSQQGEKTPGDGEWDVWSCLDLLLSIVAVGFGVYDGKCRRRRRLRRQKTTTDVGGSVAQQQTLWVWVSRAVCSCFAFVVAVVVVVGIGTPTGDDDGGDDDDDNYNATHKKPPFHTS